MAEQAEQQRTHTKQQPNKTSVHFQIEERTTKETFVSYLCGILSLSYLRLTRWALDENGVILAEAEFESLSKAKQAVKVLSKRGRGFEASLQEFTFPSFISSIDNFKESIQTKKQQLIINHSQKVENLNEQLMALKIPKRCSPEEFVRLNHKRQVVQEKVTECEKQQLEFAGYCEQLHPKLEHLKSSVSNARKVVEKNLMTMRKNFGRECCRFTKALPIYARRQEIVEIVSHQQVTILIGETGCGKSTQLVQYLYDAGVGSGGLIACTQPRKVAAVSLAKYVSEEMGARLGVEIGYKVGMQGGRFSEHTQLVFMTDHALLNECVEDRNFTKYSCIVVDEAHERSLQTDILLALIKQCLPHRPDLKVIITSATIDPQQFIQYFGSHCPILRVSGRTFPVSVIWNPLNIPDLPSDTDYCDNAVKMAESIHREEAAGDVLVFLTSAAEIDRACVAMTERVGDTAVVLPLHGKMQPDDQQKVFQMYGLRKIVFATNVAETSVTIPGVKYIVDTGLAKELFFNPKKNMNSLEVRPISKSSAEQRKGRAGRTSEGKCYRLYSDEVHAAMTERTAPEILRVHLTHAALKLFQLGVGNILQFDFVEAPSQDALCKAMETLEFLEAVKDNELTDLGKRMAVLPIDPQFAKILFLGAEAGIGHEAAISVAMSSCGGGVFFRSDEVKEESDKKKIQFCHHGGDQMTNLNVYWKWAQEKKEDRNRWCVDNYVNAKTMRLVEEVVKELRVICEQQFKIMLHARIPDLQLAEEKLPRLYFEVFMRNICVFLGHERVGYMTKDLAGEAVVIFPGSALPTLNDSPQFLVFEKTLKTSQHFLLQVTPVKEEWVQEAVAAKQLSAHPNDTFKQYFVSPVRVPRIGQEVFRLAFFGKGKLQQLKQDLSHTCNDTPHTFIIQKDKAVVCLYCQAQYHVAAKTMIEDIVKGIRTEMRVKVLEWGVTRKEDDVRVVLGAGGSIQSITMPDEYRTLIVKGQHSESWVNEIAGLLSSYGNIASVNTRANLSSTFVTFCNPDDAAKAYSAIQPLLEEGITVHPSMKKSSGEGSQFTVRVEWCRRKKQNFAFLSFESPEDSLIALASLSSLIVAGSILKFRPSKDGQPQLFVTNVGQQVTEEALKQAVELRLQAYDISVKAVKIGLEKGYPTTPEQLQAYKRQLETVISRYATKGQYTIDLKSPQPHHPMHLAFVHFRNPEEGHRTLTELCHEQIGDNFLQAKACLSSSISYPKKVFAALKDTIDEAMDEIRRMHNGSVAVKVLDSPSHPTNLVKLTSNDVHAFIQAKNLLNSVLQPDTIQCLSHELRQYLLRKSTREELEAIGAETSTFISADLRVMTVNIYGAEGNRTLAKVELNGRIEASIQPGIVCRTIELKAPGRPPGLMKFVVSQFGTDLSTLLEREGVSDATLDARRHILTLYCKEESLKSVQELLDNFSPSTRSQNPAMQSPDEEDITCCVCYCPVEEVAEQCRLEYCGHLYCLDCVQVQISPNAVTFPITCAAEDCGQPFVWHDFESLFKRTKYRLEGLLKSSLQSYVLAHQREVKSCPTPNCDMIYKVSTAENGRPFLCSHCGVRICAKCHVQYHDGLSCAMYMSGKDSDKEFETWLRRDPHNRKKCPNCTTPIEKIEGCQHMTCMCGAHICWHCLRHFADSQQCYAHLAKSHGGFV